MNPELQIRNLDIKTVLADMPRSESVTTWHNQTSTAQTVTLFVGRRVEFINATGGRDWREINDRLNVVIPPGAKQKIPSKYDGMIQRRDAVGNVCGGIAPMLTKVGDPAIVDECILPISDAESKKQLDALKRARLRFDADR